MVATDRHIRTQIGSVLPVLLAMFVYALLLYGNQVAVTGPTILMFIAPVAYGVLLYLYYGVARLAFEQQTFWLWGGAVGAIGFCFILVGMSGVWTVLTGWSALFFGSVLAGRLTRMGKRPRTVVTISLIAVAIFTGAQLYPLWMQFGVAWDTNSSAMFQEIHKQLMTMGESQVRVEEFMESVKKILTVLFHLLPAITLMSALAQFMIGYLLFIRWIDRNHLSVPQYEPFHYWKMPFWLTAPFILLIIGRLMGGEAIQQFTDNGIAIVAFLYAIGGLALLQFGIRKARMSRLTRVMLYVLIIMAPMVSILAALTIGCLAVLAGFADSFADWRRIRLRELA